MQVFLDPTTAPNLAAPAQPTQDSNTTGRDESSMVIAVEKAEEEGVGQEGEGEVAKVAGEGRQGSRVARMACRPRGFDGLNSLGGRLTNSFRSN